MTDRYYIPDISEFHIGFEYEFRPRLRQGIMKYIEGNHEYVSWWKTQVIGKEDKTILEIIENHRDPFSIDDVISYHKDGAVRVKYLDREDIESLGFVISGQSDCIFLKRATVKFPPLLELGNITVGINFTGVINNVFYFMFLMKRLIPLE